MRRPLETFLLLGVLLTVTAPVAAAPPQVPLPEYRGRLEQALRHLEAAEQTARANPAGARHELNGALEALGQQWAVQTPGGAVEADHSRLRDLIGRADPATDDGRLLLSAAVQLAREHLVAAREPAEPQPLPERARVQVRVEQHLQGVAAEKRWTAWLEDWLSRLLGRWFKQGESAGVNGKALWWVALVGGLAGAALLAHGIARNLTGHGPGSEAVTGQGRRAAVARPLTPEELSQSARELAGRGEHKEAVRTAHLAVLKHLDRLELIRYGTAKTHREHEQQLRRVRPGLARRLRVLNDLVEACIYSGRAATAQDFWACERQVDELWREGEAVSKDAAETPGAS